MAVNLKIFQIIWW